MKDKRQSQTSINDLVHEHRAESPKVKQISLDNESVKDEVISQEALEAIFNYNSNLTNLDELYTKLLPTSKVLVRVKLHEPTKTENGLLIPYKQMLPVPTNSGYGSLAEIESSYPYSNVAVVVATPGISSVAVGDLVQLDFAPVRIVGTGYNATVVVPDGYLHPAANSYIVPTNPSDRHYGYLLIPSHAISMKLNG